MSGYVHVLGLEKKKKRVLYAQHVADELHARRIYKCIEAPEIPYHNTMWASLASLTDQSQHGG